MHVVASLFSNMHFTRTHVIVLLVLLQETVASIPRHNVPMVAKASVLRPARHSLPFMSKPRWDSRPPSLLRFRRSGPEMEKRRLGKETSRNYVGTNNVFFTPPPHTYWGMLLLNSCDQDCIEFGFQVIFGFGFQILREKFRQAFRVAIFLSAARQLRRFFSML